MSMTHKIGGLANGLAQMPGGSIMFATVEAMLKYKTRLGVKQRELNN